MKVTVKYLSQIRKATNVPQEEVELNHAISVQELIKTVLCKKYEKLSQVILDQSGALRPIILVFHQQKPVKEGTPSLIENGDIITIMAPITGG